MTDELLPALPKAAACIRKEALNYPDGKDDYLVWDADLANENDELIYTEAQMRAYAREAIRLSHTWPTLRDDEATTHPHLEGLIAELNAVATLADEARVAYAGHHASGTFRRIAERLDAARSALAALPGGGDWQPIETAPKDGTPILAFWPTPTYWPVDGEIAGSNYGVAEFRDGEWRPADDDTEWATPSHWMPLPSSPTPLPHEADRNG